MSKRHLVFLLQKVEIIDALRLGLRSTRRNGKLQMFTRVNLFPAPAYLHSIQLDHLTNIQAAQRNSHASLILSFLHTRHAFAVS